VSRNEKGSTWITKEDRDRLSKTGGEELSKAEKKEHYMNVLRQREKKGALGTSVWQTRRSGGYMEKEGGALAASYAQKEKRQGIEGDSMESARKRDLDEEQDENT